jgi:hypothetical protein
MLQRIDPEFIAFAEQYRQFLPEGFIQEVHSLESELVQNRPIQSIAAKGRGKAWKTANISIRAAILGELALFLCGDHSRYKDLRTQGRKLTKDSVIFIAGVIAGTLGITSGAATAGVAFVALACLRVGVGTFCRLYPLPAKDQLRYRDGKRSGRRKPDAKSPQRLGQPLRNDG